MIRITLLSDTHSFLDQACLKLCEGSDEIWHAGDIGKAEVSEALKELAPLRAVYGNIDDQTCRADFPLDAEFQLGGMKFWMTHIGGYPNRYSKRVRELMPLKRPDVFISGHSHILKVMRDSRFNLLHLNPGAMGLQGWHKSRTLLRFKIQDQKIQDLEVAELPRWPAKN